MSIQDGHTNILFIECNIVIYFNCIITAKTLTIPIKQTHFQTMTSKGTNESPQAEDEKTMPSEVGLMEETTQTVSASGKTQAQIEAQKFIQQLYNKTQKQKTKKKKQAQQTSVKLQEDQNHPRKKSINKREKKGKTAKSKEKKNKTKQKKQSKVKQQEQLVKQQGDQYPTRKKRKQNIQAKLQEQIKIQAVQGKTPKQRKGRSKSKKKQGQSLERQIMDDLQRGVKLAEDQISNNTEQEPTLNEAMSQADTDKSSKRDIVKKKREKYKAEDQKKVQQILKLRDEKDAREEAEWLVKQQRQIQLRFGNKMQLEFNPNCKHYDQYKIKKDQIEKKGKLYCQIYNKAPVPPDSKQYFEFKIVRLTFQSVTVGVITSDNFQYQYSRDKSNCICFDAYTHSTYIEGAQTELQAEIAVSDIIRTVVDIPCRTMQWYINNELISEAAIPEHIAQKELFPCIEISNKWIKIRINKVE